MDSFLPYGKQTIEQDDIDSVAEVLKGDFLTTGPKILEFEKLFAEKTTAKECVVIGNGTQALHLTCLALDLQEGDYAIVPDITFLATANAVRYCGADVIFCDVDPDTGIMTPETFLQAIKNNPDKNIKCVLPVHLGGQVADLEKIKEIADQHNIKIIADSCHAVGGHFKGSAIGSGLYEDMATFSFHPVKNMTMGEGGAITTSNSDLADKMRTLRSHGMVHDQSKGPWFYEMPDIGYNYRATDIQCALGISQINKVDRFVKRRQELADLYDRYLDGISEFIQPPKRLTNINPAWHLYALRIDFKGLGITRADFMVALKDKSVGSQVHYIPVSSQPYYKNLYGEADLPQARKYYESTLSIPLFPMMKDGDVERVVNAIQDII